MPLAPLVHATAEARGEEAGVAERIRGSLGFDQVEVPVAPAHQHGDALVSPRRGRPGNRDVCPFRAAPRRASWACAARDDSRGTCAAPWYRGRGRSTRTLLAGLQPATSVAPSRTPSAPDRRRWSSRHLARCFTAWLSSFSSAVAERGEQVAIRSDAHQLMIVKLHRDFGAVQMPLLGHHHVGFASRPVRPEASTILANLPSSFCCSLAGNPSCIPL